MPARKTVTGYPGLDRLRKHILLMEGHGDKVTNVPTGFGGMTKDRYEKIRTKNPLLGLPQWGQTEPDRQHQLTAINTHLNRMYGSLTDPSSSNYLKGFDTLGPAAQDAILSSGYNMGIGSFDKFERFKLAVEAGDSYGAMTQLLDTANVTVDENGKPKRYSVKGLAVRRAREFNSVADRHGKMRIDEVIQDEDGTISYIGTDKKGNRKEIMKYTRPRFVSSDSESKPGTVDLRKKR